MILSEHEKMMRQSSPAVYGLVLAGGLSTRMNEDKGFIVYRNNQAQRDLCYNILSPVCERVFYSGRLGQTFSGVSQENILFDMGESKGPLAAILTAFEKHSQVAWLVLACDLPYIDTPEIDHLLSERDPQKVATAFRSPTDQLPEPLVALWEPSSYPVAKEFFEKGFFCPRKFLINADVKLIDPLETQSLINANLPAERDAAKKYYLLNHSHMREVPSNDYTQR